MAFIVFMSNDTVFSFPWLSKKPFCIFRFIS